MRVRRFRDEYRLLAPLFDTDEAGLRRVDAETDEGLGRWYALEDGIPIGAVTATRRPDGRAFLRFRVVTHRAYAALADASSTSLGVPLHANCDQSEVARLEAAGFSKEVANDRFVVPFDVVLPRLSRAWVPSGYSIRPVTEVDEDAAFALDNALRSLVPGTDGWSGNRSWFSAELRSDEFDPSTYLVAMRNPTDSPVGLLRIWRNPDGPRLGLLGVLPEHRVPSLAARLLREGTAAAARWGFESFRTETSPDNPDTGPLMRRMGLDPVGRTYQMVLQP